MRPPHYYYRPDPGPDGLGCAWVVLLLTLVVAVMFVAQSYEDVDRAGCAARG